MRRWIEHDAEWYEQRLVHCDCCGRLIAKHLLAAEINGHAHIFCGDGCADLYEGYVLTERGRDYRPPTGIGESYESRMTQ
jgi:hypothetical protein